MGNLTKQVVSYGGGVNSTALMLGLYERNEIPDYVLFSDTGGERPATYAHIAKFSEWLSAHGMPTITTVKNHIMTLEEHCLKYNTLPSIILGLRQCSHRWKVAPQEKYLADRQIFRYTKVLGIDAGEPHRVKDYQNKTRYPLIEWQWFRKDCIATIERHGVEVPTKSSCFFCPVNKRQQITDLAHNNPDLFARALAMEANATALYGIKGLAKTKSWLDVVKNNCEQGNFFEETPCECFDESEE